MSEDTCIALVIITVMIAPLIAMPITLANLDKHDEPDRITKLEQRVENLEKVITTLNIKGE